MAFEDNVKKYFKIGELYRRVEYDCNTIHTCTGYLQSPKCHGQKCEGYHRVFGQCNGFVPLFDGDENHKFCAFCAEGNDRFVAISKSNVRW